VTRNLSTITVWGIGHFDISIQQKKESKIDVKGETGDP
jgi:hypothetical protein